MERIEEVKTLLVNAVIVDDQRERFCLADMIFFLDKYIRTLVYQFKAQ